MEETNDATGGTPARVEIAGRVVNPVGLTLAGQQPTGMWGAAPGRAMAVRTIRRAVELGVELIEVPVPFGPWADLLREADVEEEVVVVARLTGPGPGADAVLRRLGRHQQLALVLAEPQLLDEARAWDVAPVGVVAGPTSVPSTFGDVAAVRGPWPAPRRVLEWCAARRVPYLAPSAGILAAAPTAAVPTAAAPPATAAATPPALPAVALLRAASPKEAERVFAGSPGRGPSTPPAAGPG